MNQEISTQIKLSAQLSYITICHWTFLKLTSTILTKLRTRAQTYWPLVHIFDLIAQNRAVTSRWKRKLRVSFRSKVAHSTPSLFAMNAHYAQLIYHLTTNNELRIKQIKLKICMFTAQFHRVYCFKRIVFHSFFFLMSQPAHAIHPIVSRSVPRQR